MSNNEEEDILSESIIDDIMFEMEKKTVEKENEDDDHEKPIKYFPDCDDCKEKIQDCIKCILREIRESDDLQN